MIFIIINFETTRRNGEVCLDNYNKLTGGTTEHVSISLNLDNWGEYPKLDEKSKFYMASKYAKFWNLGPIKTPVRNKVQVYLYGPLRW
jgi:tRNA splicing ligase